jgi:uncharacterized protein (TIGR02265 family)
LPASGAVSTVAIVDDDGRALDLVAAHCDIVERLRLVPPTARLRGMLFRSIERQLELRGHLEAYRRYFPRDCYSSIPFYSLHAYMLRIAVAGALAASPERLHEGMYDVSRGNAQAFADSLIGCALIRLLARDPVRLTEQGLAAQRQMASYGRWAIVRRGGREIEMQYRDEYVWIESVMAGSAAGTFESCGIRAELETSLSGRFSGRTVVRW